MISGYPASAAYPGLSLDHALQVHPWGLHLVACQSSYWEVMVVEPHLLVAAAGILQFGKAAEV